MFLVLFQLQVLIVIYTIVSVSDAMGKYIFGCKTFLHRQWCYFKIYLNTAG